MRQRGRVRGLWVCLFLALGVPGDSSAATPDFTALEAELVASCEDGRFSGAVEVLIEGAPVFRHLCGENISAQSRYKIFSTTKFLTALAIMRLVEIDHLKLDSPIEAYLDDLPAAWHGVTIRQLLNHTSGIPDETNALLGIFQTDHSTAMRNLFADMRDAPPLETEPGMAWRYNNFGYELLAETAARVEGMTFNQVLADRVLIPGGLADAVVELAIVGEDGEPSSAPDPRLVTGYIRDESGRHEATSYSFVQLGAGSVHAALADFEALDIAMGQNRIVNADTWRLMISTPQQMSAAVPTSLYGLGVMIQDRGHMTAQGHTGGNNGYITSYRRYPAANASVVILSNFGWSEVKPIEEMVGETLQKSQQDAAD